MGFLGTVIIYALIGAVVGAAILLGDPRTGSMSSLSLFLLACVFWPVYLPLMLKGAEGARQEESPGPHACTTDLDLRIDQSEARLVCALTKLDGVAVEVLEPEVARIRGLAIALRGMAKRLSEMDELLKTPELSLERASELLAELSAGGKAADDARVESVRARIKNIERLGAMKRRSADELERALFKMEEMSSQIVLLKFAGRPEAEVLQMIKEIAASVEGVAEGVFEAA
jgi:hypothetical protein